jgi:protein translocase SecG subunit
MFGMELLTALLPYLQIATSLLLIAGILLQQRGATLGGALGADNFSSTFNKRRGAEKFIFNATIAIAILWVLSNIIAFILPR